MKIASSDTDREVLLIAEIGNNHEGNFETAMTLVQKAAACGVDAVKFQTFQTNFFIRSDEKISEIFRGFELSYDSFTALQKEAHRLGLLFISTPLDIPSAHFLSSLVDAFKISSGDNDFFPLMEAICESDKPVILSSGQSELPLLKRAKACIVDAWKRRGISSELAILHCVSSYPVADEQANLASIAFLKDELNCTIGYSDHTLGLEACFAAVALGARIIEKHFTLDKHFSGFRDHLLSADPEEMKRLVEGVKRVNQMMGERKKVIQSGEREIGYRMRRSAVASRKLSPGEVLFPDAMLWLRPGDGLRLTEEEVWRGKKLKREILPGQRIAPEDLE